MSDNKILKQDNDHDHRKIGLDQKLFFFHESSPGSCFFLPHGTLIYNKLVELIRNEYRFRNFKEVITPNILNKKVWETSGHWEHYSKNMFTTNVDNEIYALKPMNCCGHCLMFGSSTKSYRDLPLRLADFGVLHRNELHGALTGLTRVRKFSQDDAHIFCTELQVSSEINSCLDFLKKIYGIFGFDYSLALSTRPEKYVGDIDVWNNAESQLTNALESSGLQWCIKPGDGAFYGPKIDIQLRDSSGRSHQCATIQLDFNLPKKFNLEYQDSDGVLKTPVMIHRAIFGSVERMFAILCEHYAGKWPFWISPRQICVIPVNAKFNDYADKIKNVYSEKGYNVEVDLSDNALNKKIRDAAVEQFNFIFVVGEKEMNTSTVNVRNRNGKVLGQFNNHDVLKNFSQIIDNYSDKNEFSNIA